MKRKIIQIDEEKCNGCGLCIPNCQEGALQIIDNKARLISDLFCDGLGACIGHCPEEAIQIIEREAEPYDEFKVMQVLVGKGKNTIMAHLQHLRDNHENELLSQAIQYLTQNNIDMNIQEQKQMNQNGQGCPGSRPMDFRESKYQAVVSQETIPEGGGMTSELRQWPIQLHLLNPQASYFHNANVLLAADCVAFAMSNFHAKYLKGKSLAIACPKLDSNKESYLEKLKSMITETKIDSMTVIIMEVPCCGGLLQLSKLAREQAGRNTPIKRVLISIQGEILEEEWV